MGEVGQLGLERALPHPLGKHLPLDCNYLKSKHQPDLLLGPMGAHDINEHVVDVQARTPQHRQVERHAAHVRQMRVQSRCVCAHAPCHLREHLQDIALLCTAHKRTYCYALHARNSSLKVCARRNCVQTSASTQQAAMPPQAE